MARTITPIEQSTIVQQYQSGLGATTIAKNLGRSEFFVKYELKLQGIPIRKTSDGLYRKYSLNPGYFDKIDTAEKAYWLGFLYADGYNYEKIGAVKLCLNVKDADQIEKFKIAIGSNQKLVRNAGNMRDNTIQVTINNRQFSSALARHGCYQNKSLTLRFPVLDEKLNSAFMLGYFDGDGSICLTGPVFAITSSFDFCTEYQKVLVSNSEVNLTKLYRKPKHLGQPTNSSAWCMHYCGRGNVRKIYGFLYNSVLPGMPRKRAKFVELLGTTV